MAKEVKISEERLIELLKYERSYHSLVATMEGIFKSNKKEETYEKEDGTKKKIPYYRIPWYDADELIERKVERL